MTPVFGIEKRVDAKTSVSLIACKLIAVKHKHGNGFKFRMLKLSTIKTNAKKIFLLKQPKKKKKKLNAVGSSFVHFFLKI